MDYHWSDYIPGICCAIGTILLAIALLFGSY